MTVFVIQYVFGGEKKEKEIIQKDISLVDIVENILTLDLIDIEDLRKKRKTTNGIEIKPDYQNKKKRKKIE